MQVNDPTEHCILTFISCRICKKESGEFVMLDTNMKMGIDEADRPLLEHYNECTQLEASIGDPLPQMICMNCVETLQIVRKFLLIAQQTDKEFREILKKHQKNEDALNDMEADEDDDSDHVESLNENKGENIYSGRSSSESMDDLKEVEESTEMDILNINDVNKESLTSFRKTQKQREPLIKNHESVSKNFKLVKESIEIKRLPLTNQLYSSPESITKQMAANNLQLHCKVCDINYANEYLLKKHTQLCHKKTQRLDKNFLCNTCGKRFKTSQKLKQHLLVHTKDKNYKCTLCEKTFATIYRQRDHLKMHINERNFICEICDKRFTTRPNLKLHLVTHTEERPFSCGVCRKSFQQRSVLKTHMTLHNGKLSECAICHRKFSRSSHLNIHMRLHTGERPYKCQQCDNAYMQKSHLDRHMGLHLGIRFNCTECEKVYTKKSTLDSHIRMKHTHYACNICSIQFDKQKGYHYHMSTKHRKSEDSTNCNKYIVEENNV